MNDLLQLNFGATGATLQDVAMNPNAYPAEIRGAYLDVIKAMKSQLREVEQIIEAHLLSEMVHDNATKMVFKSIDGRDMVATRKKGSVQCKEKDADERYKSEGFDPLEIGNYEFKASWTKAKEARKLGGDKQLIIDELFKEQKESIVITEK